MTQIPSNFRPDIRPIGPSGSFLRSLPGYRYGVVWDYLTQSDIIVDFNIDSVAIVPSAVLIGDSYTSPGFTITYNTSASGASILAVGSGYQAIASPYTSGIFVGTFVNTTYAGSGILFQILATGTHGSDSFNVSGLWLNKQYYGASPTGTYNELFIKTLPSGRLALNHTLTVNVSNTGTANYLFYGFRAAAGHPKFFDNGANLYGGFSIVSSGVSLTNDAGFTESYNLYRADYPNLGTISISVENS